MAARTSTTAAPHGRRALEPAEKRLLALLGVPTFALALAVTVTTTYLPVVTQSFIGSNVIIGLIIGIEGLMALWVPLVAGTWSDRLKTRWGGRLPFVVTATPFAVVALVLMGLASSGGFVAITVAVFFVAYFTTYEPYRALYPDALPDEISGRGQSTQALFRGAGTAFALVVGGLLVSLAKPAPFVAGAFVLAVAIAAFVVVLLRRGSQEGTERERSPGEDEGFVRSEAVRLWRLLREHPALRAFLAANALWELSLGALKTFVILYITRGLGYSTSVAALIVGGVALILLVAAWTSGKLADRMGRTRLMRRALPVYGIGLLVPFVFPTPWIVAAVIPVVAFGGGVVMTLPYAILIPLMPKEHHGALTGFYTFSRGVGNALGPLLAGVAITALGPLLSSTDGYAAMWLVCGAAILLSLLPLRRLRDRQGDRRELRAA